VRPRYLIGVVLLATLRRLLAPGDAADLRDRPEAQEELLRSREALATAEQRYRSLLQKPFDVGALADTIREVLDDDASAGSADPLPVTQP